MQAFAIRLYGKRWLRMSPRPDQDDPLNGWRAMTWTDDVTDAEKWADRESAQHFADTLPGRAEVRELQPATAPIPTGGRIRLAVNTNLRVAA